MKYRLQNIYKKYSDLSLIVLIMMIQVGVFGQVEICNNGIDDDGDSLIDINDDDCICQVFEPLSLIPNPSFEEQNCCPTDRSQLDCAADWIQASEATTDFIHACDWLGWPQFPPPQPFPDGDGIMGFRDGRVRSTNNPEPYWKEYAGACLLSPLRADTSYRFQFDLGFVDEAQSPPIDITFFGTTDCSNLPFGRNNIAFGCPTNSSSWIKLGEVSVSGDGGNRWVNTSIDIVSNVDIYAIAIGPSCDPIDTPTSLYYFFDNLLLTNLEFFDLQISESTHPCNQDFTLSVPENPNLEYQWYMGGVALQGEVSAELTQNYGEGDYQVRILDGGSCRISGIYDYVIPSFDIPAKIFICEGESYDFGDLKLSTTGTYLDTFQSANNCDSIVALNLEVIGQQFDTVEIAIIDGGTYEIGDFAFDETGDYPLVFNSSKDCDSLVLLKLTNFSVFIPNAFSPDGDGVNDTFLPYASDGRIITVKMSVFDRWGNLFYEGSEWDGSNAEPNVYVYVVNIDFENGGSKTFHGSIALLR